MMIGVKKGHYSITVECRLKEWLKISEYCRGHNMIVQQRFRIGFTLRQYVSSCFIVQSNPS